MLKKKCQDIAREIVEWRRDFHRYPELSYEEKRTSAVVANFMRENGLHVKEKVGGYGVIGDLKGAADGPTVAFRADMDALPIQEETDLPFASQVPGVMHACGHDGHTAVLMGAVRVLAAMKEEWNGTIRFVFQPAEEVAPGGARKMIDEGALEGVDAIFGLHLWSEFPSGTFYTTLGPMMAASDRFEVRIEGKGGHGALPHKTIDPILIASQFVMSAQHIVSRKVDPLQSGVLSFGELHSGSAFNVIAQTAELKGTTRSFSPEVRDLLEQNLEQLAESLSRMYGAKIDVNYERGYPAVLNHKREAQAALEEAASVFGEKQTAIMDPCMAGEDFAYYLQKVPGAFCFVGAGDPSKPVYPHHHPKFVIDERVLPLATEWICRMALRYVKSR